MGSPAAFARIAPFAAFILFVALQPLAEARLDERWWVVARGLVVAALLAFYWRSYTELRRSPSPLGQDRGGGQRSPSPLGEGRGEGQRSPSPLGEGRGEGQIPPSPVGRGDALTAANLSLAVIVGLVVFLAWITFDADWAKLGKDHPFVPLHPDGSKDFLLIALRLFGMVLVVPVMEELFWRSFLMRWLDRRDFLAADPRAASLTAFALSSALFATEHSQWLAGLAAGLAYGWLYKRTGNLWLPILSHAITNGTLGYWILATGQWHYW